MLNYLKSTNQLGFIQDYSKEQQFESYMQSFQMYMWGVKNLKDNPESMKQKWKMAQAVISYYCKDSEILNIMNRIKNDIDSDIYSYIENFKIQNVRETDYDNENECLIPILRSFEKKYYIKDENGRKRINYDYIYSMDKEDNYENQEESPRKK